MQTAGINIVAKWDAKEVDEGLKALRDKLSNLKLPSVGSGGSKGSGSSGGGSSTKKEIDLIGQLRKSTNESLRAVENLTLAQGARAQATLREQTVYASLKDKLDQVVSTSRKQIDSYGRLTQVANQATRWAQNLGVTYGTSSKEFQNASERAKKLTDRLKEIDAATGRNFRNVGNYTGSIKGLTASLGQITREIPSTLNNIQTMFLSFSNNLPAVGDNIKALIENNRKLKAEGKPTTSVIKSLGLALFSWNTAMVIGIALLTKYGPEMVTWVKSLFDGGKAAKFVREEQEELNKAHLDSHKQAGESISRLTVLNGILVSNASSAKSKKEAYYEIITQYPQYKAQLEDEYKRTGNLANAINTLLVPAILNSAKARAYESRLKDLTSRQITLTEKQTKQFNQLRAAKRAYDKEVAAGGSFSGVRDVGLGAIVSDSETELDRASRKFNTIRNTAIDTQVELNQVSGKIREYADAVVEFSNKGISVTNKIPKEAKGAKTEAQKLADAIKDVDKSLKGLEDQLASNLIGDFEYLTEKSKVLNNGIDKLTKDFNVKPGNSVLTNWAEQARVTNGELRTIEMTLGNIRTAAKTDVMGTLESLRDGPQDDRWKKLNKSITPDWTSIFKGSKMPAEVESYYKRLAEWIAKGNDTAKKELDKLKGIVTDGINGALGGLGESIAAAFLKVENPFGALLGFLGQSIKEFGKYLIELGGIREIMDKAIQALGISGAPAIVAGIAAVGLGTYLQSLATKKGKQSFRAFADGGIAYGPTMGLVGEYPGASSNPEVIAPLNKLREIIGNNGTQVFIAENRIDGRDLVTVYKRAEKYNNR